jgi:hypothetical protein
MRVFHATLLVALQRIGTPVAVDTPCPVGPRNCGQPLLGGSAADKMDTDEMAADNISQEHGMVFMHTRIEVTIQLGLVIICRRVAAPNRRQPL